MKRVEETSKARIFHKKTEKKKKSFYGVKYESRNIKIQNPQIKKPKKEEKGKERMKINLFLRRK